MVFRQTFPAIFLATFALGSFSVYANDDGLLSSSSSTVAPIIDQSYRIQRPQIPTGIDVLRLPHMSKVGNQFRANCYAAYLIEKLALREHRNERRDREVSFQIRVTNVGECTLNDLTIKDFLPDDARLVKSFPRPDFSGSSEAVWNLDHLEVGRTAYFDVEFRVRSRDHDRSTERNRDRDRDNDRWITNNVCVWSPMIGQQACAWSSVWVENEHGRQDRP